MKETILSAIILLSLLSSCIDTTSNFKNVVSKSSNNKEKLIIDTVVIALDSISKPYYFAKISVLQSDSDLFYVAYNSQAKTLDWFDLFNKKIEHTQIESIGPNGIPEVSMVYPISKDSIFIFSYNTLYLINRNGFVLKKLNTSVTNEKGRKGYLMSNASIGAFYDKSQNIMYCGINYVDYKDNETEPQAVIYNLTDNTYKFLPVYYSEDFNKNYKQLGYTNNFSMQFYDDELIFNFSYKPDIYIYNYKKEITTEVKSSKRKSFDSFRMVSNKASESEKMDCYIRNALYNLPQKCQKNKFYYRLSWKESSYPYKIENKKIVLTKYSHDLKTFSDFYIDNKIYFFGSEKVLNDGIVIIAQNKFTSNIDDEKIIFHIIK